jgi:hypothetical protein
VALAADEFVVTAGGGDACGAFVPAAGLPSDGVAAVVLDIGVADPGCT